MIIDCHCHIASHDLLPPPFLNGWARTIKANLGSRLDAQQEKRIDDLLYDLNEDPQCTKLLEEMDAAGIDMAVLLVIDFGVVFKQSRKSIEELHLDHKKVVDRSQRFVAFSSVDPRRGREGVELFDRAINEWGFKGLKVYAPCGFSPSDEMLFPYYEICGQKKLPVLSHVGPTSSALSFKQMHPLSIDDAALNFPSVNFILGHAGVMLYREAALLAEYRPNIYLDLSGFQAELNKGGFKEILRWHISRGLAKRLVFGTDWPIYRLWGSQARWVNEIKACRDAGILSDEDADDILFNNMKSLLGLQ
jgi:predicted TIM-barrel fold metal-dependent hydrolase